jgi:hypothetical protein
MTAHLPGTGTGTSITCGWFNLLLWAPPPHFLVKLCGHVSVFYKKASEIKHVNLVVDILVCHELKNVVQNLF